MDLRSSTGKVIRIHTNRCKIVPQKEAALDGLPGARDVFPKTYKSFAPLDDVDEEEDLVLLSNEAGARPAGVSPRKLRSRGEASVREIPASSRI